MRRRRHGGSGCERGEGVVVGCGRLQGEPDAGGVRAVCCCIFLCGNVGEKLAAFGDFQDLTETVVQPSL